MEASYFVIRIGVGALGALVLSSGAAYAQEINQERPSIPMEPAIKVAAAVMPTPSNVVVEDGIDAGEETLSSSFFVDTFYMADWNNPSIPDATSELPHRAFDFTNGFALAFAGADLNYQVKEVGLTLDLRFGEGANRLIGNQESPVFSILKQAYVTWTPSSKVTFDAGQFDTIYGAEVADSWENTNYTRGALYYLMQPFYHTGFRSNLTISWASARLDLPYGFHEAL